MRGVTTRLFAFLALLLVCGSASADPVSGFFSLISAALSGVTVGGVALGTVASWAAVAVSVVSGLSKASQARKQARQAAARKAAEDAANLRDRTTTIVSAESPWTTIYGAPAPVGGSIVAVLDSGGQAQFKHVVIVFAAHECEAIDEIFIEGTSVGRPNATGWTDGAEFQLPPPFKGLPSEGPAVNVQFHTSPGGVDTADVFMRDSLKATFPDLDLWTDAHRLSGYTYAVVTLNMLFERFQGGLPAITARIRGKKVYDPRNGQTRYSRNPALCLADFIRSEAGYLAAADQIDEAALIGAASACDDQVYTGVDAENYGNSNVRYTCDGAFRSDQDRESTRQQLEESMAGFSLETGGVWRIQAGAWSTAVLNLTDVDMLSPTAVVQTANVGADRINGVRGTYVNAARNGVNEDFKPYQNTVFRAQDEKDKFRDMALAFTGSHVRCHQLARVAVEQSRGGLVLRIHPKMLAWHLQPGDRIVLSSALYGFNNKTFRVQDWSYQRNAPLSLQVIEDVPAYYDLADEVLSDAAPNTNLPSPFIAPQTPMDLMVKSGPELMVQQGGSTVVRARVSWAPWADDAAARTGAIRVQWRLMQTGEGWQSIDLPGDAVETFLLGLSVGGVYQVRARFATPYAVSSWVMVEHVVTGKTQPPGSVSGLQLGVENDGVHARWAEPAGLDLLDWNLTELRIGTDWATAAEVWSGKAVQANLGWLQTGVVKLWASHGDTTGRWSTPVSTAIEILSPAQPVLTGQAFRDQVELQWPASGTTQPLRGYEVRVGSVYAEARVLNLVDALGYKYTQTVPGTYLYWVCAVDLAGNRSAPGFKELITLPGIDEALEELQEGLQETVDQLKQSDSANAAAIAQEAQNRAAALVAEGQARGQAVQAEAQNRTRQVAGLTEAIADEAADRAAADAAEVQARVAAVAREASDRLAAVQAEANLRADAIAAEQNARAAALIAEAAARGTAISNEASMRQQADGALASQLTTLTASLSTTTAALQTEQSTRANGDEAEATARQQLATRLQLAESTLAASIASEAIARSTANAAEARSRESLSAALTGQANVGATLADVQGPSMRLDLAASRLAVWQPLTITNVSGVLGEERQARIAADAAEVTARETMRAQLTGGYEGSDLSKVVSGLLHQERSARASQDEALAQQMTLISAGVGEQFDYTRIWYFDADAEGWNGNGAPDAVAGWLRPANRVGDPYVTSPTGLASAGAIFSQMRLRIRKVGAPAWAGQIFWRTQADSGFEEGRSAAMVEPTYDSAGIGMVNVNPGWSGSIDQIRIDLSAAQSASDYFEIDWVAIGRPSPGASNAALQAEAMARASADAAQVTERETLAAQLRGTYVGGSLEQLTSGLLAAERDTRVAADMAEAKLREQLSATVVGNKANIDAALESERTARAGADAAEARARESLGASLSTGLSTVSANLVAEKAARADADAAEVVARESLAAQLRGGYAGSDIDAVSGGLIASERQARITADQAEATQRQVLETTVADNKARADAQIVTEQAARSDGDAANARTISALSTSMSAGLVDSAAALQTEIDARSTADLAEVTQRQGLSVALTGRTDASGTLVTVVGPSVRLDFVGTSLRAWDPLTGATLTSGLLYEERQARIDADSAEVATRQLLAASLSSGLSTTNAGLLNEQRARIDADTAQVQSLGALSTMVANNQIASSAALTSEASARARADSAEAAQRQVLSAALTGSSDLAASLSEVKGPSMRLAFAATPVVGLRVWQPLSLGGLANGLIYEERTARITADEASASVITGVSTRLSATETKVQSSASVLSVLSTSVDAIGGKLTAQATQIGQLSTSVGQSAVAITNTATALAELDGKVKGSWRLNVDANGKVSGLILDNNGSTSSMVVQVDKFAIAQDGPGGETRFPFVVGDIGGESSIGVNGNMFIDGSIKARSLDVEQLTATISRLNYISSGRITINGDMSGNDWGYIRSPGKWRDDKKGWVLAQHPNGSMFVDFNVDKCGLVMHYDQASQAARFRLWGPKFNLDNDGLKIGEAVIGTLSIAEGAVTVPTGRSDTGATVGITHKVPNINGASILTYITASTFIPPYAGGGLGGSMTIFVDGVAHWVGVGVPGSTVTGVVVKDLVPGDHSIAAVGTFGGSSTSIFALSCQR
ncbi:hypothetical protein SAMN05443579_1046 [Variovorax sp. PDC80]|uniref:hypothetical protein n=1 Tax=Variovorax sp. PDC80 TaxID=1882827 RepID=UPI0008EC71D0|nr:hypothetical protein [Variovorax sp. PDC80]SFO58694.1 hypothetical protein SAMN05443579_1046 [Variovorax sp. PDC80]